MSKELFIDRRVGSLAEAQELAKRELHNHNRNQITASIDMAGAPKFYAGMNVNLKGAGKLNGKYHVDSVSLNYSNGGGFTSSLNLHIAASGGGLK